MAENKESIEAFDRDIRTTVQAAIDADISRPAIAGIMMAVAADFNQSKKLMAAYDTPDVKKDDAKS